jgi:hypothetical protein
MSAQAAQTAWLQLKPCLKSAFALSTRNSISSFVNIILVFTLFLRQFLSIIVNFFNKNTPSLKATKIYKNQVVMFCFCSNEMQPCRIWGAKQKLNPISNSQSPIANRPSPLYHSIL